ncbi:MAG: fumarate hydratase C-terminal domain-containing protein [Kiritimatiellae bacterium]|nr:fumarate hydratase C-terminal domain-containing protein [Kiritimatiellia bacterium]
MKELTYPFSESAVRELRAGDAVRISGRVCTGRDRFHKFLADGGNCPVDLRDGALFHCGPVAVPAENDAGWRIVAAGPTTSIREEPYEAGVIAQLGLRVIIGKGGMGAATVTACREHGCVYLQAVGGAAALIAQRVRRVAGVHFLKEFGMTEACWELDLDGLEAVVGIDTYGRDLFAGVRDESYGRLAALTGTEK